MSEVEKFALSTNGDAPVAETVDLKTCNVNEPLQPSTTVEYADIVPENATVPATEVTIPTLNALIKTGCSIEVNDANTLAKEVTNLITTTADATTSKDVEIVDTIAEKPNEDVSLQQIDTQKPVTKTEDSAKVVLPEATPRSANEEKTDKSKRNAMQTRSNNAASISKLEVEVRKRTVERDSYQKKLEDTEKKLATLQAAYDAITSQGGDENIKNILQQSVEQLRSQLVQTALLYEERNRLIANQENQINALNNQVISLKEVVSITRDLLQIRNMEVKQLQNEVDNMERRIIEERDRHNTMITKMDAAMRLNADLKKEYETQLSLFQSLREKYGEKIILLSKEKEALEAAAAASTPE